MTVLDFQVITPRGVVEQIMRIADGVVTIIPPTAQQVPTLADVPAQLPPDT